MASIMQKSKYTNEDLNTEIFEHSRWLRLAGFALLCIGVATIIVPFLTGLHSIAVLAGLLAASGILYAMHAVVFWQYRWLGFSLHALAGIIYGVTGYMVFIYPLANIQILAEILIISYVVAGLFRIVTAISQGITNLGWSWTLLCGIINIALAGAILIQLTVITPGLLALIIGIELAFTGWALLRLGINASNAYRSN